MRNNNGFGIYTVIAVLAFIALVFILVVPSYVDVNAKQKTEEDIANMKEIYLATQDWMVEKGMDYTAVTDSSLIKARKLNKTLYCPGGNPDQKYTIKGEFASGKISVISPLADKFPDRILPVDWMEQQEDLFKDKLTEAKKAAASQAANPAAAATPAAPGAAPATPGTAPGK